MKQPKLTVVRDTPSVPTVETVVVPESAHRRALRVRLGTRRWDVVGEAARLAAIGLVLVRGASELRPGMSARSAAAWVQSHAEDVERAQLDGAREYSGTADLRDAVLGAAAEVDEAGAKTPALVSALYSVVSRVEAFVAPTTLPPLTMPLTLRDLYIFGTDVLCAERTAV